MADSVAIFLCVFCFGIGAWFAYFLVDCMGHRLNDFIQRSNREANIAEYVIWRHNRKTSGDGDR